MIYLLITILTILALFLALFLLYVVWFVRPQGRQPEDASLLCNYAHRGLHGDGIPENSMKAFEAACEKGYGMELDIRLSKDGQVMVFHDNTLTRMTGCEKVFDTLNVSEIQELKLLDTDQTVPLFKDVLELVDGRTPLLIELKGEKLNSDLCKKAADLLKDYKGSYCIESFNPFLIREIKKHMPNCYTGQLFTNVCKNKKKYSIVNMLLSCMTFNFLAHPDFIAYSQTYRNSLPVKLTTKFYKAPKFVWTIKTEEQAENAKNNNECMIFEKILV